jgi:spore germination protein
MKYHRSMAVVILAALSIFVFSMASAVTAPIIITAWLHTNDWNLGVDSFANHASAIRVVSPAWYRPTSDGDVEPIPGAPVDDPRLLRAVRSSGVTLRPLLMNVRQGSFSAELILPMLQDATLREKHIRAIISLIQSHEYDGIDIDYEALGADDLALFADFITQLGNALHAETTTIHGVKTLGVTIESKFANNPKNAWSSVASAADAVELLAYPEHQTSTVPGPIASLPFVRSRLQAAVAFIPKEKVTLGIPIYAITWGKATASGSWATLVEPLFSRVDMSRNRDRLSGSPYVTMPGQTTWYEDGRSVTQKIELAQSLGVNHVAFWRLGGEDPDIWNRLE